jgi:peptidoglycan/xylan/chitin deacetylase (PgdA/CDA1 family)
MTRSNVLNVCFHGIGLPQRELEPGEEAYWLDADRCLKILDEVATWPSVHISFDDANISDVQFALPALVERGLSAQFFLLAGRLGRQGSLDPDDVRELVCRGMTIGTHGMSHRSWRRLNPAARETELIEARQRIEDVAGVPVSDAACPLGRYDRRLLADLRRLGYRRVYTSDRQAARLDSWLQPRFSVRREDTPESLRAAMLIRPGLTRRTRRNVVGLVKRLTLQYPAAAHRPRPG